MAPGPGVSAILTTLPEPLLDEHKVTSVEVTLEMLIGMVLWVILTVELNAPILSVAKVGNGLAVLFVAEFDALYATPAPSGSFVHTKL